VGASVAGWVFFSLAPLSPPPPLSSSPPPRGGGGGGGGGGPGVRGPG